MAQERGSGGDLPAEYVDPWRLLRRDLGAVAASLRLRVQELWRRNREADLWCPPFWPERLAPWFWPLLLILLLSLLALLPIGLGRLRAAVSPPASPPPPAVAGSLPSPLPAKSPPKTLPPETVLPETALPETVQPETPQPETVQPETAPLPVPPEPVRDPLLVTLEPDGDPLLLLDATPLPARGLLRLTVAPAYGRLPADLRRQRALAWWTSAQDLGYERFELRDRRGLLQARSALVGEGIVLFEGGGAEVA